MPAVPAPKPAAQPGARPNAEFDKIVSVFLVARAGQTLNGPDLVVAAEKAGLVYGHMNIFHRLVDNHPELGPVFSVANLVKPGSFDLRAIKELQTPGVNFFITLPGPMSALDAWDTLLPTAQRMAELLDAVLLDEQRNALGRQRIANIRDELRAYDRAREKQQIRPGR
jgi:cell division protein ZipA